MVQLDWLRRLAAVIDGPGPLMVFQPIVRLSDGARVGFEALSRFPEDRLPAGSSDSGLTDEAGLGFGPDVWFSQADLQGLGVELELSAVAAALSRLEDVPADCYVAVNVGPEALVSGQMAAAVAGMDLSRVVVELTEHLAVEDYNALRSAVVALQDQHSRVCTKIPKVAADDMGAGSASLRHLLELRSVLDFCKLDLSLTRDIHLDQGRQVIAAAIVGMGAADGFRVVAEGIETADQLEALRSMGVHAGQGWLLGRPGPLPRSAALA